jgi:hypothetical protein
VDDAGYREPAPSERVFESIAGVDSIRRDGPRLVLFSPDPMPEWKVGNYRKTAIHFRGARYAVVSTRPVVGGHEYVLDPWPLRPNELAGTEITYDEAYVRERQADLAELRKRRKQFWMIVPVWPLLGFLPIGLKEETRMRFGLEPISATHRSVLLEIVAFVLMSGLLIGGVESLSLPIVFIVIDLVMRVTILFDDSYPPYGFWEWIVHPEVKEILRASYAKYKERRAEARNAKSPPK